MAYRGIPASKRRATVVGEYDPQVRRGGHHRPVAGLDEPIRKELVERATGERALLEGQSRVELRLDPARLAGIADEVVLVLGGPRVREGREDSEAQLAARVHDGCLYERP